MMERSLPAEDAGRAPRAAGSWRERAARRAVLARLEGLERGELLVTEAGRSLAFGAPDPDAGLRADVTVREPSFWPAVALGGTLGAGEAWIRGTWSCDDPTALVRILLRSRELLEGFDRGLARLATPARLLARALARNTRGGSRRNVAAHYDLGNDFFERFLDPTLTYSCGIFERPEATMEEASVAKYERLCRKLALRPGERVLEIGSGWGGFALHAAERYGCRVTTATISRAQHERATERVRAAGLEGRVSVLLGDYRDLRGTFDKLVSIEMIEAVGHEYLPAFFRVCAERLAPEGLAALQAITIDDRVYERTRKNVDFIKRYVFPGGNVPSLAAMTDAMARGSDLRLVHLEDITPHYAETLRRWRARFLENRAEIRARGYSEELLRLWEFYLAYCEGGFEERHIGDVQMLLAKPGARRPPVLGALAPPAGGPAAPLRRGCGA